MNLKHVYHWVSAMALIFVLTGCTPPNLPTVPTPTSLDTEPQETAVTPNEPTPTRAVLDGTATPPEDGALPGETASPTPTAVPGTDPGQMTPARVIQSADVAGLISTTLGLPETVQDLLWPAPGFLPQSPDAGLLLHSGSNLYPVILRPDHMETARLGDPIALPTSGATLMAIAPDASSLLVQQDGQVRLISPDGQTLHPIEHPSPYSASYSDDSRFLVITSLNEFAADVYDTTNGERLNHLTGFTTAAPVYNVEIAPGGKTVFFVARATVQFQDVQSGQMAGALRFQDFVSSYTFSPDGSKLALTVENRLAVYSVHDAQLLTETTYSQAVNSLAFSPAGDLLAAGYGPGIQFWDAATLEPLGNLPGPNNFTGQVAFSPDGLFLVSIHENNQLLVWRTP